MLGIQITNGDNPYSFCAVLSVLLLLLSGWLGYFALTSYFKASGEFDSHRVLAEDATTAVISERQKLFRESLPTLSQEEVEAIKKVNSITGVDPESAKLHMQLAKAINAGEFSSSASPQSKKLEELTTTVNEAIRVANEKYTAKLNAQVVSGWVGLAAIICFTIGVPLLAVIPFWFIDHIRRKRELKA